MLLDMGAERVCDPTREGCVAMIDSVRELRELPDRFEAVRRATKKMAEARQEATELGRLRKLLIAELHDEGHSYGDIAKAVGLSRGRIHQIKQDGPAAEGAFLGSGSITVAIPVKRETIRSRPVVAVEDTDVASQLKDLAESFGLDCSTERIPVGGAIDLNRAGLIVVSGPRISPAIAEVLDQDPFIRFERDHDQVWTLVDRQTGQRYRSGQDQDPPRPNDTAYLGRLRRPDGLGDLIIFTGIHPQGSLGVAHLISTRIDELYRQAKTDRFSVIVGADYDPDTHSPTRVELLSPIYRHEAV